MKRCKNILQLLRNNWHNYADEYDSIWDYINVYFIASDNLTLSEVIALLQKQIRHI